MSEILKQGAEAKILIGEYNNQQCIIKERFIKNYRHSQLDSHLTKERMRAESKAVSRCQAAGLIVPKIYHMDLNNRRIYMEYFDKSITAKVYINEFIPKIEAIEEQNNSLNELAEKIGRVIGTMHAHNIIHGDLTTSNILLDPKSGSKDFRDYNVVMIDFGLAGYGQSTEQKGVDLYVLERALLSTHSAVPKLFPVILEAYKESNTKDSKETITKFEEVRTRGRKRTMIG